MSASTRAPIEAGPLERVAADLVVVGFAPEDRPLRGAAGRADWRMCGRLSGLVAAGRLTGRRGEAALLGAAGGLRSPAVLVVGLGPRDELDALAREEVARDALLRALDLRAESIAVGLLDDVQEADAPAAAREAAISALQAGAARAASERGRSARLLWVGTLSEYSTLRDLIAPSPLSSGVRGPTPGVRRRAAAPSARRTQPSHPFK